MTDWRKRREKKQEQHRTNRIEFTRQLENAHVEFESKNDGTHLIIRLRVATIDFWPGTEKWHLRATPFNDERYDTGFDKLMKGISHQNSRSDLPSINM